MVILNLIPILCVCSLIDNAAKEITKTAKAVSSLVLNFKLLLGFLVPKAVFLSNHAKSVLNYLR